MIPGAQAPEASGQEFSDPFSTKETDTEIQRAK